ncbi:MAG: hypothetical protein LBU14_02915 [Candidatus Peribacteria bacterium]|nr:hypothetical protein [Candidatus Peribacteria bacterium]
MCRICFREKANV